MGRVITEQITIVRQLTEEMVRHFPSIYNGIFDELDPFQMPSVLYCAFQGEEFIGFISGYLTNSLTLYIQYAGVPKDKRGHRTLKLFREGLKEIDKEFIYTMTAIKNTNIPAIKIAMSEGFIPHGIRQDTKGQLYLELIRQRGT